MEMLKHEWKGPHKVICRDVGPLGVRLEPLPRVWVEFMSFPIHLWSKEAFEKICKVWGKFVIEDVVNSKKLSFTAPRVLVDSYTWEPIQEWIALRVDDRTFEIYAREHGRDVYSIQAHPVVMIPKDLVVRTMEIELGEMEAL
ncbi:hypothetical protein PIB30_043916 [Stylosanthes scabra]|uniref:DUF4283 domain-containing protein n=1 Tax=Stylosanthes scabra TaxID=79078 RepID=A0ABU6UIH1_9FABA|nr:hypothetical protein [Stylosanthes scabra]